MSEERRPLLTPEGDGGTLGSTGSRTTVITVRPINNDDMPTINYNSDGSASPVTCCQVCGSSINLEGKMNQHVVKCPQCTEANPIKAPPPGKKYVRCPCNCLLICKQTSQRIACPRRNCNRVMQVQSSDTAGLLPAVQFPTSRTANANQSLLVSINNTSTETSGSGIYAARVCCAYCSTPFTVDASHISFIEMVHVRCPQCSRKSFLNSYYRFKRMLLWYSLALLFAIAGAVVLGVLHKDLDAGKIAAFAVPFGCAVICLVAAIYYSCLKVSEIQ